EAIPQARPPADLPVIRLLVDHAPCASFPSTTSRRPAAGVALQAGAVPHQGEVAAFAAGIAFVPFHAGLADAGGAVVFHRQGADGDVFAHGHLAAAEHRVRLGVGDGGGRAMAAAAILAAMHDVEIVANEAGAGEAADLRRHGRGGGGALVAGIGVVAAAELALLLAPAHRVGLEVGRLDVRQVGAPEV